jgi:alpha-N-acetylglucosaminidase
MAFWDFPRWQRELDWMALNGINLALASVIGQECVWRNVMGRMGQTEPEIRQFIAGPAFEPWWLMDNLEAWGGPVWDRWIENRRQLQTQILGHMRSLGIAPVFQGFYGMVPSTLKKHYPKAAIVDTGEWCMFSRPPMLLPGDPLFDDTTAQVGIDQAPGNVGNRRAKNLIRNPGFSGKPHERLVFEYAHRPACP